MEITAPVNQRPAAGEGGEKMEMAVPVTQRPQGGADTDT